MFQTENTLKAQKNTLMGQRLVIYLIKRRKYAYHAWMK